MKFEVETGQVAATVSRLQSALDNVSAKRERMFQAIEALNGMWVGQSHDAFEAQSKTDNTLVLAAIAEIQEVIDAVSTARQSYDQCEQSAKELAASLNI